MNPKTVNDLWKVNSLRFTVFPKENFSISDNWWESLTGSQPNNITNQPKFQLRHYEGTYESGTFIIETDPVRISLIYTQNVSSQQNFSSFFSLSEYNEIINYFVPIIDKWFSLPDCPVAQRIAYGGILLAPVKNKLEGYQKLDSYLPALHIDTQNSADFLYQINRPRLSKVVPNLLLNRLSKWLLIRFQASVTQFFAKIPQVNHLNAEYAVNLEFDINTDGDNIGDFSPDKQKELFAELRELCEEIALNGDIG